MKVSDLFNTKGIGLEALNILNYKYHIKLTQRDYANICSYIFDYTDVSLYNDSVIKIYPIDIYGERVDNYKIDMLTPFDISIYNDLTGNINFTDWFCDNHEFHDHSNSELIQYFLGMEIDEDSLEQYDWSELVAIIIKDIYCFTKCFNFLKHNQYIDNDANLNTTSELVEDHNHLIKNWHIKDKLKYLCKFLMNTLFNFWLGVFSSLLGIISMSLFMCGIAFICANELLIGLLVLCIGAIMFIEMGKNFNY